jgi:hypothetical protein
LGSATAALRAQASSVVRVSARHHAPSSALGAAVISMPRTCSDPAMLSALQKAK